MRIEYEVVIASDTRAFGLKVNAALEQGWKLQGGVSVCDRNIGYSTSGKFNDFTMAQALYREIHDDQPV